MAERLAPLSIVTAVAVARALRAVSGVSVGIKWPNDIVLDGRKIGGVLVESGEIAGEPVSGAVVGIGVNVGHAESDFPPELEGTAASVAMIAGKPVDRIKVLASVLEHFEEHYREFLAEGFAPARERWRTFSTTLDREITVESCGRRITGTVVDMAPSGALVVEDPTGQRVEIWHGDVVPGTMSTADHVVQDGAGARHD
jgi:BirA family biotin operon repressor/biotin-[acetyl-CoA-carboxylase] ligase